MQLAFQTLKNSKLLANAGALSGSAAVGPLASLLMAPLLTRLYSPDTFGLFLAAVAPVYAASGIATLRFESAIPLASSNAESGSTFWLALLATTTLATFGGALLLINPSSIFPSFGSFWICLLASVFFFGGLIRSLTMLSLREKNFRAIAMSRMILGLSIPLLQIGFAFCFKPSPTGLLFGQALGNLLGVATLFIAGPAIGFSKLSDVNSALKRYWRFPAISTFPALINGFWANGPVLLFSTFYSAAATGAFGFSVRLISGPLDIVSGSSSQILLADGASARRKQESLRPAIKSIFKLQGFVAVCALLMVPFCPVIFPKLFGRDWYDSGIYALLLAPGLLAGFFVSPLGCLLDICERQGLHFLREILRLLAAVLVIAILSVFRPTPFTFALIVSGVFILFAFIYAGVSIYALRQFEKKQ